MGIEPGDHQSSLCVQEKAFEGTEVRLDGAQYINCKFKNCVLIFGACGPVRFEGNDVDGCSWRFVQAAADTIHFMEAIYAMGPAGAAAMEATFDNIRRAAGEEAKRPHPGAAAYSAVDSEEVAFIDNISIGFETAVRSVRSKGVTGARNIAISGETVRALAGTGDLGALLESLGLPEGVPPRVLRDAVEQMKVAPSESHSKVEVVKRSGLMEYLDAGANVASIADALSKLARSDLVPRVVEFLGSR